MLWLDHRESFPFVVRVHRENLSLVWWPNFLDYFDQLRVGHFTFIEWLACEKLAHHTPSRPHVYRVSIVSCPEHQLRRPVVPWADVGSRFVVCLEFFSRSKVAYFQDVASWVDQKVLWFNIPMDDLFELHVVKGTEKLVHVALGEERVHSLLEGFEVLDYAVDVGWD